MMDLGADPDPRLDTGSCWTLNQIAQKVVDKYT